jgi:hypothetical protein
VVCGECKGDFEVRSLSGEPLLSLHMCTPSYLKLLLQVEPIKRQTSWA